MAEETLVIDITADTSGLQPTIDLLEKLGKIDAKTAELFRKANVDIQAQQKALKGVGDQAKNTGKQLSDAGKEGAKGLNELSTSIKSIAGALGIGLTVAALKEFVSSSIKAFDEQEVALQRLKSALQDIAGEGGNAFATLKTGAEELQRASIFSDEQIEQVQSMLVTLGLTSEQTEILTKRIVDTASRTGKSLEEITGAFTLAIEGQTKGLRSLGASFKATGDQVQDFNLLLESTAKFAGGAGQALETQAGQAAQLKNQINELEEAIGQASAPIRLFFLETAKNILELFAPAADKAKEGADKIRAATALAFKDIPIAEIEENIKTLQALSKELLDSFIPGQTSPEEAKAANDRIINIDAQIAALQELIALKKQSAKDDADFGKADREVKNKSIEQLKLEIELLGRRNDANTINVKAAIEARENQIKVLEELNKKALKDSEDAQKKQTQLLKDSEEERFRLTEENLKKFQAQQKEAILKRNLTAEENEEALANLELLILEIRRQNYIQFKKDIGDLDNAIADLKLKNIKRVELAQETSTVKTTKSVGDSIQDEIDRIDAQQERVKEIINQLGELGDATSELFAGISQQRINELEEFRDLQQEAFDEESDALKQKLDKDLITQAQYENQLSELRKKKAADEKRIDNEIKKIRQEQAVRDKAFNIFETIINTSRGIAAAAPDLLLQALIAAVGAVQLAKIISTPIPKFHKGKLATLDSSEQHAIIRKDETILSPENSKQYSDTLTAIHNRQISPSILNNFVRMSIGKMPSSKNVVSKFPDIDVAGGMKSALRKGVTIRNTNELGKAIADNLPQENIRRAV